MLKVLKYEWKLGFRSVKNTLIAGNLLSLLFGLLVGLLGTVVYNLDGLFQGFSGEGITDTVVMVASIAWMAVWFAQFVQTVDFIIKALSSRMFAPEGYLAHTLPLETWELLGGKALGVWLFGVFMAVVAAVQIWIVLLTGLLLSGALPEFVKYLWQVLPELTPYHWATLGQAIGWLFLALVAFLGAAAIGVVNLQFICIAARQFGKHHLAGGIIVLVILLNIEGRLTSATHLGTLITILMAIACFCGSNYLLKKHLSV